jgi:signal transduction histidine kinase
MDNDLIKENQKLKEMLALKSNLISMTVHEIRTASVALKWILKMVLDKDAGSITKEQETLLSKAYESNERAITMINEFLSANQSEDATISYKFEEADILKLLEDVISDFSAEAFKEGIEIRLSTPSEKIPYLKIDPPKVRIIFQNLIDNAIKYSDRGGEVSISMRRDDGFMEFKVEDQGIGIATGAQSRIFEKFFRGENAKKKKSIGTGLGLTTTKSIVEKHGGKIWFESKEGEGSAFYFTLPIT